MKPPIEFPYEVGNVEQADVIGYALHKVMHFDVDWVRRVYTGDTKLCYQTGPAVILNELRGLWRDYMTIDERRQIMVIVTTERLK